MFHHHHNKGTPSPPTTPSQVERVRLLQDREELQSAVERARDFERRGISEYQRRVGNYDRFLEAGDGPPANVVPIDTSAEAS
jgi:hypothetical protein